MTNQERVQLYPLTEAQKRVWYIEKIYPNTAMSNIGRAVKISGKVDSELLMQSVLIFIEQNPGVRIRITCKEGNPYQ